MSKFSVIRVCLLFCFIGGILSFVYKSKVPAALDKAEMVKYLLSPANNLIQEDSIRKVKYSLLFWPEGMVNSRLTDHIKTSDVNATGNYFMLRCSYLNKDLLGSTNPAYDYAAVLKAVSFDLPVYIFAVLDKKDTVRLAKSVYARSYGMTGSTSVLLFFNHRKRYNSCEIFVKDFVFNSDERIKFKFNADDITNCPNVNP